MAFPSNVLALADVVGTSFFNVAWGGVTKMSTGLNSIKSHLVAIEKRLGTGTQVAPARGLALVGQGVADSDGNQQSIWDRHARKNIILNPNWAVNDQGSSILIVDNTYIGGNWRGLVEAASACTVARELTDLPPGGARAAWKLITGPSNTSKFGMFQAIEGADMWDLRAQVSSLQVGLKTTSGIGFVKAAVLQWTGTEDAVSADPISVWGAENVNPTLAAGWAYASTPVNLGVTTAWATYYVAENVSISGSATNLAVMVWVDDKNMTQTTDYLLVGDPQLERGAVCTAVERRKAIEEWNLDAWYATVMGIGSAAFTPYGAGFNYATTAGVIALLYPRKRIVPAVSFSATADFQVFAANGATVVCTGLSASAIGSEGAELNITVASGLTIAQGTELLGVSSSARIKILARI